MKKYFEKNYTKLRNLAEIITRSDYNKDSLADDLIQETYLAIDKIDDDKAQELVKGGKEYLYIYSIMHRQYFMRGASFNKLYKQQPFPEDDIESFIEDDEDFVSYDNTESLQLGKIQHYLKDFTKYERTLFLMYYSPQRFFKIEDYNGKMSYRKLGKLIGINFLTIRAVVDSVHKQLMEKIHINNDNNKI